jgi:hypothetical protein
MPTLTANLTTYNAVGNREQLLNAAYLVAQNDAPFVTQICAREKGDAKFVEWQTDDLPTPTTNAVIEGANAGTVQSFTTARVGNRMQLMEVPLQVSTSQQNVKAAGRSSEEARQLAIAYKKIILDLEFAALGTSAAVTGDASTTASRMRGAESWFSTNAAHGAGGSTNAGTGVVTDGTQRAMTKALLDTQLQAVFTAGGNPGVIMTGAANKRNLSALITGTNNRQVIAEKKAIVDAVDIYMSDYGTLQIIPNRTQRDRTLFIFQEDLHAVAFLQEPYDMELGRNGHAKRMLVAAEATYICRNERGNGKLADLTT